MQVRNWQLDFDPPRRQATQTEQDHFYHAYGGRGCVSLYKLTETVTATLSKYQSISLSDPMRRGRGAVTTFCVKGAQE